MVSNVHELNTLLVDLRAIVVQLELLKRRAKIPAVVTQKLLQLSQVAEELRLTYSDYPQDQWKNLVNALEGFRTTITHEFEARRNRRSNRALKAKLADRYEHILYTIRSIPDLRRVAERVQTLRPTNYLRNLYHVGNGLLGVVMYEWVFANQFQTVMGLIVLLAFYGLLDAARRFSPRFNQFLFDGIFGKISRPRERYETPSGIWYIAGLLGAVLIAPQAYAQAAAIALGFGDPAASIFGKKWGKRKIYKERSLVGTCAFVLSVALVSMLFFVGLKGYTVWAAFWPACVAAVVGATMELLSTDRLDDNLIIPIGVAGALTVLC